GRPNDRLQEPVYRRAHTRRRSPTIIRRLGLARWTEGEPFGVRHVACHRGFRWRAHAGHRREPRPRPPGALTQARPRAAGEPRPRPAAERPPQAPTWLPEGIGRSAPRRAANMAAASQPTPRRLTMATAYSIGIDLHRTVIQICVLDERGERVAEERIRYRNL